MAEVITAKTAGFCFGVKRAVEEVYNEISSGRKIYTYGPIIHNDEVVKDLESKGVTTIREDAQLSMVKKEDTIIIRSHGITKSEYENLEATGAKLIDMTCPFVKRIHDIVKEHADTHNIIIIGDPEHPEVMAIKSYAGLHSKVIENAESAERYVPDVDLPICLVSQTTFHHQKFKNLVDILAKKGYYITVVNTICDATRRRQEEAEDIASQVDLMIVIGDTKSSNSRKLYEICKAKCEKTHFIQTLEELHIEEHASPRMIGITAGASTPNNIIEEVQKYVRNDF